MVAWLKRWILSILLGIDQLGHVVLAPILFYRIANEDETISSALGRLKLAHGGTIPCWPYPLARAIDVMLEWIDPGHSIDAVESDEIETLINRLLKDDEKEDGR